MGVARVADDERAGRLLHAAPGPLSLHRSLVLTGTLVTVVSIFAIALVSEANPGLELLLGCYVLVGSATAIVGLVAWARRPSNSTGTLLVVSGLLTIGAAIGNAANPTIAIIGSAFGEAPIGALLHLVIAFPSGRLNGRGARALVVAGYIATIGFQLPQAFFTDPPGPFANADVVRVSDLLQTGLADTTLVVAAVVMVLRVRSRQNTTAQRRVLVGVYAYGIWTMLFLPISAHILNRVFGLSPISVFGLQLSVYFALPFVFAAGILRGGFGRTGELVELGAWLGTNDGRRPLLRDALADSLGDPSLYLLFRRLDADGYIDVNGLPATPPGAGRWQTGVEIEGHAGPAGMIVYDNGLIADPQLVRSAGRVLSLALERERLTAELIASRDAVRLSRTRIVEVADAERRRLALDLHDLLQNRLVLAALQAGTLAAAKTSPEPTRDVAVRLRLELDEAINELRGLVQGVMPALLLERGLFVAAEDLGDRLPIPTKVGLTGSDSGIPAALASTGYFILAETFSNVVKHSGATRVDVQLTRLDDVLILEVNDDGVGGAAIGAGAGLRGLGDRVDAYDGRLIIDSPAGQGTRVLVELPCAS